MNGTKVDTLEHGSVDSACESSDIDLMDVDMDVDTSSTDQMDNDPDLLYRELYPKFSGSRKAEVAPRSGSACSPPAVLPELDSASTLSSVMLLTPPNLLNRSISPPLTVDRHSLDPKAMDLDADDAMDVGQDLPSPVDEPYLQGLARFAPKPLPNVQPPHTLNHTDGKLLDLQSLRTSPYLHRSPFLHIPERRSAPKRSLELSQTDTVWPPSCVPKALQEPIPPICANNSLGLELDTQHIEHSVMPLSPPYLHDIGKWGSATSTLPMRRSTRKPTGNPVSPPVCRSPLVSLQIANALSALNLPDEGLRSVEAAKFELGKQEAEYIARRLAEEQKRRQAKEKAANTEERGRSRVKKRTASYTSGSILG